MTKTIQVRKAAAADEAAVLRMWQAARERLAAEKIPQWQGDYPAAADFQADVQAGIGRVAVLADGAVVGYAAVVTTPDPNYAKIDGAWLTANQPYQAIHRFVVDGTHLHAGFGRAFMSALLTAAQAAGLPSVRVDTHAQNLPMHRLLADFAFQHTGTVWMVDSDGTPRDAYELLFAE